MAVYKPIKEDARLAGADLSQAVGLAVKLNSSGQLILCGAGDRPYGWVYEAAAQGHPVTVHQLGIVKAKAGGTIAPGARVQTGANGVMVSVGSSDGGWGTNRETANAVINQFFALSVD